MIKQTVLLLIPKKSTLQVNDVCYKMKLRIISSSLSLIFDNIAL